MARPRRTSAPLSTASHSAALNAARRTRELDELGTSAHPLDVLVIGGGVTGAGVALDAASRGLRVALVEAHDLAFGTSRWSSKLVHGGLRYLATGDIATARESARERHLLLTTIAPHLIRSLPQVLPFTPAVSGRQRFFGTLGMGLGDGLRMLAGTRAATLAPPRLISAQRAYELAPALNADGLRGGVVSHDGQLVDDARLVVVIARTAAAFGARILTRVRATHIAGDGATVEDTLTGETLQLRARSVINATGVWAGTLDDGIRVRPSRGTHIVLDAARLGSPSSALMVPHPGSISRFVFALPQQLGRVIVGLTDEDAPGPVPDVALPTEAEIDFLLTTLSSVLESPLDRTDVRGTFAGLRPLVETTESAASGSSADVSRRHLTRVGDDGVIAILGGKLTTYRAMAQDAVDRACAEYDLPAQPCVTPRLPLVGAPGSPIRVSQSTATALPPSLVARFGTEAAAVFATASCARPTDAIVDGLDITRAEIDFAVSHEGALDAGDVLDRRTRIGLVRDDRGRAEDTVSSLVDEALAKWG